MAEFDEHVDAAQAALKDSQSSASSYPASLRDRMVSIAQVEATLALACAVRSLVNHA